MGYGTVRRDERMTLEPERERKGMSYGKYRKVQILKRQRQREKESLERRSSLGSGLSEQETARLQFLREIHDD